MHEINYVVFGSRMTPKGIQRECDKIAKRYGDYHTPCDQIRFPNVVCKSYKDAYDWLNANDRDGYDCVAIKYKDDRRTCWLAKIEYHV